MYAGCELCDCVCEGSSSYTYQESDSVSTITVCTLLCIQAVTVTGRVRPAGRGCPTTRVRRERECQYNHSVYCAMFTGCEACVCNREGSSNYTCVERDSVNTIIVCTVQCLQAVRHVTVTGRGGPTARVWRERVNTIILCSVQ